MRIAVAQTKPVKGDMQHNVDQHKKLIAVAIANKADLVIFPELSITGYEPALAKDLATYKEDSRFDDFQKISTTETITIGIGAPLKTVNGITISMIIFQPSAPVQSYAKQYLHSDEYPYFVKGDEQLVFKISDDTIAPAICYELSVPEHSQKANNLGANIYIASVAKTAAGVEKAYTDLSSIAKKYSMTVLLSNCIGCCDGVECGGRSAVWNNKGVLLEHLDNATEGLLIHDTDTSKVTKKLF